MTDHQREDWSQLARLREELDEAAAAFLPLYEGEIEAYRKQISSGMDDALADLRQSMGDISGNNRVCVQLAEQITEYVGWMQWALWDLPYFAVAIRPSMDRFGQAVVACGLVYISIRIFDDVVDQHFFYKGHHQTLLAATSESISDSGKAEGLTFLAGLLLCFEGLHRLTAFGHQPLTSTLLQTVQSVRRTIIGAIMEYSEADEWTPSYYDLLVQLKNVDYWRSLYAALDPEGTSPLYPFLQQYYEVAQNLNDIQDFDQDMRWGQPNLLSIYMPGGHNGRADCPPLIPGAHPRTAHDTVEKLIAAKLLKLADMTVGLPDLERSIAKAKLAESLHEAYRLGLFATVSETEPDSRFPGHTPRLYWYSEIQDVIGEGGPEALENVGCPVCDFAGRKALFQKQSFTYHRCLNCSHIYVSPRITPALQTQMLKELDELTFEDEYLEVQRIYAESICHMLRDRTCGARLLDIGFGRGYLMQLAQAYGFEVYGLESSNIQVQRLRPLFGQRVTQCIIGQEVIPWDFFDVVIMSHILEHLHDPPEALRQIREHLNPGGLLYIAVPDIDSFTFKVFGKRWGVINPLAHLQYFNEASLSHLLENSGFVGLERIRHPQMRDEISPRWSRLMRQLGGSDSTELLILAKVPKTT